MRLCRAQKAALAAQTPAAPALHGWQTSSASWCTCFVWIPWSFSGRPERVFPLRLGSGPSFIPVRQNNACLSLLVYPWVSARSLLPVLHWEHSLFVYFFLPRPRRAAAEAAAVAFPLRRSPSMSACTQGRGRTGLLCSSRAAMPASA